MNDKYIDERIQTLHWENNYNRENKMRLINKLYNQGKRSKGKMKFADCRNFCLGLTMEDLRFLIWLGDYCERQI